MLCQNCGKYEATTHIKRVINGETGESHLCSKCARELGYNDFFGDFGFGISDIFTSFFGDNPLAVSSGRTERCSGCGCSFDDIIKTGKVGCAQCYEKFFDRLLPSIQRIHGKAGHSGKIPNMAHITQAGTQRETAKEPTVQEKIAAAEEKMAKAVSEQNFELAAQLRDEIKKMKGEETK